jgi:branched-chain amino acid aminotransferase
MILNEKAFLNDALVDSSDAQISIHDSGLLHGVGLFETMRAYDGCVFALHDHLDRLFTSAAALKILVTQSRDEIIAGIQEVLRANGLTDARLRLTVTPGNMLNFDQDKGPESTLIITTSKLQPYPAEYYEKGMTIIISKYKQNPDDATCGHKTLNYLPRLMALQQAQTAQAGEALFFTTNNHLAEGCISNVFLASKQTLITPPLETPVLAGVTRSKVIELAHEYDIDIDVRKCVVKDLLDAEEVFLTNSIMELMPVGRIERHPVANEKPGPIYKTLSQAYKERTSEQEASY